MILVARVELGVAHSDAFDADQYFAGSGGASSSRFSMRKGPGFSRIRQILNGGAGRS
jgi:hypothetical protein